MEELFVSETTTTLRQFVWGRYIDELVQMKVPTTTTSPPLTAGTYYPLQDLLYRTTALTDSSGNIVEAYDYDAYGNTLMFNAAGTGGNWWADNAVTTIQPMCEYLFTGREYDPETALYSYRTRYYDTEAGRFLSRDPIGYVAGVNLYGYCLDAPVILIDPGGTEVVMRFGPPADVVSWIEKGSGFNMLDATANTPPPKRFAEAGEDAIGGFLNTEEYRNHLRVTPGITCDCGNVVASHFIARQNVGYTPQPGLHKPHVQGAGELTTTEVWTLDGNCVIFKALAKFRVNWLENVGQALFNSLHRLPWAWAEISYKACCDGNGSIRFGGSYLPSHSFYISESQVGLHSMVTQPTPTTRINSFMNAGYGNPAPGALPMVD